LLGLAVRVLREHPARLAHLRARWRWLLVDEMQDTNEAQATLVQLLAGDDGNVTVVGDDDQAIYRFRSAEPRNILAFGERYPRHARVVLGRNFRSRAEILTAAACCIAINELRHPKQLAEVRDALAYLALLANPRDAHAFRRAVQAPRRGAGPATIGRVVAAARERFDGDLISTCVNAQILNGLRAQATRDALTQFGAGLD